ncbi:MAG TPA: hypothetical protein VKH43_08845 [Thermoanaerobaculia bacterium]|nr:hypothetical protein [Thermoanaerobaculia bacterium]
MRIKAFLGVAVCLVLAVSAQAQTKTSGKIHCTQATDGPKPVEAGDAAGHSMGVGKSTCTWSTPMEIAGAKAREGASVSFDDMMGAKYAGRGAHVTTMDSGDKIMVKFQGGGTIKDGKLVSDSGNWSYTGGTGKLKGIKGKGTYKGKGNPDGTLDYEIEGDYSLPGK